MNTQKFGLSRLQWILIGVLAVQIILTIVVSLPRGTRAASGPLLEGYDPSTVTEVLIENQSGEQVHLKTIDGVWVLPEAGNFPVNGDKVTELLEKIGKVQTNRLVAQTAASHNQLSVAEDNFIAKIILNEADGKSYHLFLGSSGGAGATHIRLSGNDPVYLTDQLASWEVSPTLSSWIDTEYLTLDQTQIQALSIQNANGTFKFTKGTDGKWVYEGLGEGETFNTSSFQSTIDRLTALRMLEPLGTEADPSLGFEEPAAAAVFELQGENETTSQVTLIIGGRLGENYAAKASNSSYFVKIAPTYATPLLEMDHASLLVTEPTPTPTP
jgi:hypothetical protein